MISLTTIPPYIKEKLQKIIAITYAKYSIIDKSKIFNLSTIVLTELFEKSDFKNWFSFIDPNFSQLKAIVLFVIIKEYKNINIQKASVLLGIKPRWLSKVQFQMNARHFDQIEEIKRAEFLLKNIPKNEALLITPETIAKAILIAKKFGNAMGTKSNIIASVSLTFSCQIVSNKKVAYYKYAKMFNASPSAVYSYIYLFEKIKSEFLENKEPSISKCIGFMAVDMVNFIGQIESNINETLEVQQKTALNKMIVADINRIKELIISSEFLSQLNAVCKRRNLPPISMDDSLKTIQRYYCKSIVDVFKKGMQISIANMALPIASKELIIEDQVKYTSRDDFGRKYSVISDIDRRIIMTMTEILTMRKYKKIDIRYIVIGSGDKDFAKICEIAKKNNIIVVVISHSTDSLSHCLTDIVDISVIVHPKTIFIKH